MSNSSLVSPADVYPRGGRDAGLTVLDVRAPLEVARGALPGAENVPILEDSERHRVGVAYKEAGQDAAVRLGQELTESEMPRRIERWREICERGPTALACWRGGMRSQLAQSYLGDPQVPRVEGGYKALRAHLMSGLESTLGGRRVLVVSGMTGTGKTDLIESFAGQPGLLALDLEGLARHRGSAFGHLGEQPAQQTFENELAAQVVLDPGKTVLVEDESRRIGRVHLPATLFEQMAEAPSLLLESPFEERVERIHRQYVVEPTLERGAESVFADLAAAVCRLRKRLGGELTEELQGVLERALSAGTWREVGALEPFIGPLLSEYYDPLYLRSVERLERDVVARGSREELTRWIRQQL